MKRSPLAATIIVVCLVIGVPIALFRRLAGGLLPTQAYDLVLLVAVIAWMLVSKSIIDRDEKLQSTIENRLSPMWQAHSLVEQSVFGVGFIPRQRTEDLPALADVQLWSPLTPIDGLLPPVQVQESAFGRGRQDVREEGGSVQPYPTLQFDDQAFPSILATEEYIVERGDTFWSIAEHRLGDGRRWKQIEELNVGRHVAPDRPFLEGDSIRTGWSLLVPLFTETATESAE